MTTTEQPTIAVIGLGYVGLPLAVSMGRVFSVIGFDINERRIAILKEGRDPTGEVSEGALQETTVRFTADETELRNADFVIVAVPTPVDDHNKPDLGPVLGASKTVGRNLRDGAVVVYESTVYPGVTEDECVPVLERESGKTWKKDFFVGYSPERINPGDKVHTFEKIVKVVAGDTPETLERVARVYGAVVEPGVYQAASIKVAEAAKVIENTQRDINIALMNELRIIFDKMGISTRQVLEAARTKWNFLPFEPGLVGGHCIGVDPYYLAYKAEALGHHPQLILAGRRINDAMGRYFARELIKRMAQEDLLHRGARVLVLGITFKENVPDIRNSKVPSVVDELCDFGLQVDVHDPVADSEEVREEYGIELCPNPSRGSYDAVVPAVKHAQFVGGGADGIRAWVNGKGLVFDLKEVFL
ncbi:MAG: nucleotide sugar dehydrogenase [Chitinivibrionales bacterium]|nr:nucleotide sugar dehydrogenase [Chitinivibrionales bacterium]